eukprot:TRINITY_DN14077_c0_g1_i1.p1 TRINITY_DN14077_c0_g1~~TRINITY_DN14077_c0_g1_i1.p1  ORF type:complete len:129 (-),score=31.05 TRINITY_DN14077_c0_g1_i1:125-511(-)
MRPLFILLLLVPVIFCQVQHAVHFKKSGGQQTLNIDPADTILVTLEGTPSTGYSWSVNATSSAIAKNVLHMDGSSVTDVPPNNFSFNFTTISKDAGTYDVEFDYRKPWERGQPPAQIATLSVCLICSK